jgi:hypothetical protein
MNLQARILYIASRVLVVCVTITACAFTLAVIAECYLSCVIPLPVEKGLCVAVKLLTLPVEIVAVTWGLATLSTFSLTLATWVIYRAACGIAYGPLLFGRLGVTARQAAKTSRNGPYRRSASEVEAEPAIVEDVRASCAVLGALGILVATPNVASRASALMVRIVSLADLATDPSVVAGVPIIFVSCCLLILREGRRRHRVGHLRGARTVVALVLCALGLLWVATGHVSLACSINHDDPLKHGGIGDAYNVPDFIGMHICEMAHRSRATGAFFTRTLAALLAAYAVLVSAAALNVLYLAMRASRADRT